MVRPVQSRVDDPHSAGGAALRRQSNHGVDSQYVSTTDGSGQRTKHAPQEHRQVKSVVHAQTRLSNPPLRL